MGNGKKWEKFSSLADTNRWRSRIPLGGAQFFSRAASKKWVGKVYFALEKSFRREICKYKILYFDPVFFNTFLKIPNTFPQNRFEIPRSEPAWSTRFWDVTMQKSQKSGKFGDKKETNGGAVQYQHHQFKTQKHLRCPSKQKKTKKVIKPPFCLTKSDLFLFSCFIETTGTVLQISRPKHFFPGQWERVGKTHLFRPTFSQRTVG